MPSAAGEKEAEAQLARLLDEDWEAHLREEPTFASLEGDARYAGLWEDQSPLAQERQRRRVEEVLGRLVAIERGALSGPSRLTYDLFRRRCELHLEGYRQGVHLLALTSLAGPQYDADLSRLLRFESSTDFEAWNARLAAYPERLEKLTELLKRGLATRVVPTQSAMRQVGKALQAELGASPEQCPFYAPLARARPQTVPEENWAAHVARAREAISQHVQPALRRFIAFFEREYFPAGHSADGWWQLPGGEQRYTYQIYQQTTRHLSPGEVHALGLREVARIRAKMERILTEVRFAGPLEEFFRYLREEPRFYGRDANALLEAYGAMVERVERALPLAFHPAVAPPLTVATIPESQAEVAPAAMYRAAARDGSRPAALLVNVFHAEERPTWDLPTVALHEGVPGHHLQIATARARGDSAKFRRYTSYMAYAEGWALYAESLGAELGLFGDAYARFGQLASEMWRAVRLVVDTGLHHARWDRQRAIQYFLENSPRPLDDVTREVDRYIALPAQALAYKVGELTIRGLRERAEAGLGSRFSLPDFHEVVLRGGAVPLDVLELSVSAWIVEQRPRPAADPKSVAN
ncbi:MAG TPA: DUF885 domain-containing protein [Polyangiaceae bacterium]|nr:DUF885 domain-containing protein [Polyangiaceae bacterium]